jgi:hypothetical protein
MPTYWYDLKFLPRLYSCFDSGVQQGVLRMDFSCVQIGASQDMNVLADELHSNERARGMAWIAEVWGRVSAQGEGE